MSHTPTLERISQALEPIFPIELRFTDYTRPEAGRAPAAGSTSLSFPDVLKVCRKLTDTESFTNT